MRLKVFIVKNNFIIIFIYIPKHFHNRHPSQEVNSTSKGSPRNPDFHRTHRKPGSLAHGSHDHPIIYFNYYFLMEEYHIGKKKKEKC